MLFAYAVTLLVGQQIVGTIGHNWHTRPKRELGYVQFLNTFTAEIFFKVVGATLFTGYLEHARSSLYVMVPDAVRIPGIIMVVAGLVLSFYSQYVLEANWTPGVGLNLRHRLITAGPYERMRHPLYSGIGLSMLGLAIASADGEVLLAGAFYWLGYLVRIPAEQRMMQRKFGDQYALYRARTGYLFPRFRAPRPVKLTEPTETKRARGKIVKIAPGSRPPLQRPTSTARKDAERRDRDRRRHRRH